jgi:uncharacterized membrane protein YqjE
MAEDFPQLRRLAKLFALMAGVGLVFLVLGIALCFHTTVRELPLIIPVLVVGLLAFVMGLRSIWKVRRTISKLRARR